MNGKQPIIRGLVALLLAVVTLGASAQDTERVRVACVGNSITYGANIDRRLCNGYPAYLQQFLGEGYDVRNFGENGRTMLTTADYPYVESERYAEALAFNPDIVVLKLGTNDTKPHNWTSRRAFERDMKALIHSFQALPAHPQVYVCLPVPAYLLKEGITGSVLTDKVIPSLKKVARREKLPVIDLHQGLMPYYPALFPDNCHPNAEGAAVMAGIVSQAISGQEPPVAHDPAQPFPGRVSEWEGGTRYDFVYDGRAAIVVRPAHPAPGNPWIWRPAFFGAFPSVDKALLARGWHIAYCDLTHLYGSPRSVELGTRFWQFMHEECGLAAKVVVEGLSRGGYFAFNWAAANPDKVACLYVDAPVCDLTSWPGRKDQELWNGFLKEWGVADSEVDSTFCGNAMQQLPALAKAGIPIISVCGDSDTVVPFEENFRPVGDAYRQMGGTVELIVKPGCDHHPHSLDDPTPIVTFIEQHQLR